MSDWRTRATPVQDSWKSRAKAIEPGLIDQIKSDWKSRSNKMQESADAYNAGQQSLTETITQGALQNAAKATDAVGRTVMATPVVGDVLGLIGDKVISPAVKYVSDIPVGDSTIGEKLIAESAEHPRLTRNLEAAGNALNLAGTGVGISSIGRAAPKAFEATGKKISSMVPKAEAKITSEELKALSSEQYKMAETIGGSFKPDQVANRFSDELNQFKPRAIAGKVLTSEDKEFLNHLKEFEGIKGSNLSLDDINRLDRGLTQKINKHYTDKTTGLPDNTGRQLGTLQRKLRDIVDEVPDAPGNTALINARNLWSAKNAMHDLESIAERAGMSQNPSAALRRGYANLYLDKKRTKGWPQEAKDLLKKAGSQSTTMKMLQPIQSRLMAVFMGGTGNMVGAATSQLAGMAARGVDDAFAARAGGKVQQSIARNALNKMKEVPPKKDIGQLLLAPPNKMGPLPMSDKQISIAQKLMDKKPTVQEAKVVALPESKPKGKNIGPQKGSFGLDVRKFDSLEEMKSEIDRLEGIKRIKGPKMDQADLVELQGNINSVKATYNHFSKMFPSDKKPSSTSKVIKLNKSPNKEK